MKLFNKFNIKNENIRIIVALFIFMSFTIFFGIKKNSQREPNARYTVGIVIENTFGNAYNGVKYKYKIENKLYKEWCSRPANKVAIEGSKYFITYNSKNHIQSKLFIDCPVPDSIAIIPYYGWEKIPVAEYQEISNKYFKSLREFSFESY